MAKEKDVRRMTMEYVKLLSRRISIKKAILTGSWARGSYLEDSDVDMLVVSDDFEGMPLPRRMVYLQKYWKNKLALEAFAYTDLEFRDLMKRSSYVKDAVRHGITLFNSTADLAGSGAKRSRVLEMKRLLDRMRAEDV